MGSGRRIAGGLLALAVAAGAWWWTAAGRRGTAPSASEGAGRRPWRVLLANRTVCEEDAGGAADAFAERQEPTARGTAPYLFVARQPVTKAVRARVAELGARVLAFLPQNALLVETDAAAWRRLASDAACAGLVEMGPEDKIAPRLRAAVAAGRPLDVTVVPLRRDDVAALGAFAAARGGTVLTFTDERPVLRAHVPAAAVAAFAKRGDVRWVEPYAPPTLQNNVAVNADHNLMNVRTVWETHGLTGRGQNITVSDTGIDTDNVNTMLADFTGRVYRVKKASDFGMASADTSGHGTHVAGSLVGNGTLSNGEIRGVAHGARLYMWQCLTRSGKLSMPSVAEMFQPDSRNFPAYIHSASWGSEANGAYTSSCEEIDDYVWRNPTLLPVFAVGNSSTSTSAAGSAMAPATAKNVLAVGATESYRPNETYGSCANNPAQMAYFSLRGPTTDGRIKPDICAPGTYILSTLSTQCGTNNLGWGAYAANSNYVYNSGTSMATPLVAGAAALVREWLVTRRGFTNAVPTAALVKAVLTGGARDLSACAGADCGGAAPNNRQGWGSVNLGETLFPSNRAVKLVDAIPFAEGSEHVVRVVTTNAAPLDVQLVWIDYPGDVSAAQALVNDLDLVVSNETTGAVWRGNGVVGGDHTNTVESVRLAAAPAGAYSIRVKGTTVPYESTEGGAAALYVRGALAAGTQDESAGRPAVPWYSLERRSRFPQLSDWGSEATAWYPSGTVVRVTVPVDLPDGAEILEDLVWTNDETGEETALGAQRLAEIRVVDETGAETLRRDAAGRMATAFDVAMAGNRSVWFDYYDAATVDAATGLPAWWWRRYLAADPAATAAADADGDGATNGAEWAADTDPADAASRFRIVAFSPTNIAWTGGTERTQVVERAGRLGPDVLWRGVQTNLPPTERTGRCALAPSESTNSFYRIRAL